MRRYGDLRDRAGNPLLPRLTVSSGPNIHALGRRDVEVVAVADDTVTDQQLAVAGEHALARLAHLFRHAGPGSANALLRIAAEAYRWKTLA